MSDLKDRLKEARLEAKLSQAKLAKMAGLKNQSNVANLENGHRKTTSYIVELAKALNVEPLWLSKGTGPKRQEKEDKKISDELAEFLGIPKALCTLELSEHLQSFGKMTTDQRIEALSHIDKLNKGVNKVPEKVPRERRSEPRYKRQSGTDK